VFKVNTAKKGRGGKNFERKRKKKVGPQREKKHGGRNEKRGGRFEKEKTLKNQEGEKTLQKRHIRNLYCGEGRVHHKG